MSNFQITENQIKELIESENYFYLINTVKKAKTRNSKVYVVDENDNMIKLKELVWNDEKEAIEEIQLLNK
jgi:hypothetical protein